MLAQSIAFLFILTGIGFVVLWWYLCYYLGRALAWLIFYPFFLLRDLDACFRYQCLGFGKNCKTGKQVPIFKVKTNVMYLGLTFISHRKAKQVNHDR